MPIELKKRDEKTIIKSAVAIAVSLFFAAMIDLQPAVMTYVYGVALAIILTGVFFIIKAQKDYKYILMNQPKLIHEDISLYEITDEGIMVNHYNDKTYTISIPWDSINYASIDKMRHKHLKTKNGQKDINGTKRRLTTEMSNIKNVFPDFKYDEVRVVQEDKRMILCHSSNNQVNQLPIPSSWERNGNAEKFIEVIKSHLDGRYLDHQDKIDLVDEYLPPALSNFIKKRVDK